MSRPAIIRDTILSILPFADDLRRPEDAWTVRDLAATIYTGGDPAKVRPAHLAAVGRVIYGLRRTGVVNHTARRARGGGFFWYKVHPDAIGRVLSQPPEAVDAKQELRQRLAKILGMMGSIHEGERANAAMLADELVRDSGLTWSELLGL